MLLTLLLQAPTVIAETQPGVPESQGLSEDTVIYPASFFNSYQPVSAADMVAQVPGFQVSDGDGSRGFAGAGGNVLINGERPSSKQDSVSSILARIPASRVARIELIRGNTGRFDAGGQAMLVNVVVDTTRRAWTWSSTVEQDLDSGGPTPGGVSGSVDHGKPAAGGGSAAVEILLHGRQIRKHHLGCRPLGKHLVFRQHDDRKTAGRRARCRKPRRVRTQPWSVAAAQCQQRVDFRRCHPASQHRDRLSGIGFPGAIATHTAFRTRARVRSEPALG